jgi:glycosyltransferase involved in cell wall biosynthesis
VPSLKFSISLPVLNAEKYLETCLASIYKQDYPRELIEVLVVDAGSVDSTLDIAKKYNTRILNNPKGLGEYGMQVAVRQATGDLLILFAADNGLVGNDWLKRVADVFSAYPDLPCLWGKMIASIADPAIMRYYELIQSEPLAQFLNRNLQFYLRKAKEEESHGNRYKFFRVDPRRPLCWGANGIVYRLKDVRDLFLGESYIGDNEVFQYMVEKGHNLVAYSFGLNIYHHTVDSVWHWVKKWKRNYTNIFLKTRQVRRIDWFYYGHFKLKISFWLIYSLIPIFSIIHSVYLMMRQRNVYWLYHPLMSFLQTWTYIYWTLVLPEGRKALVEHIFMKKYGKT